MRAFRSFALAAAITLHILVVYWIVSLPAGTLPSQGERAFSEVLSVNLIASMPQLSVDASALSPPENIPAIEKPDDVLVPLPSARSHDAHQAGLVPDYYPAKELTKMPRALTDLDSLYPAATPGTVAGKLLLRLWVNESGQIDRIAIMESNLPDDVDQMMLTSFRKMLFKPGEINNVPVKLWVDIVIEYGDLSRPADAPSIEIRNALPVDASQQVNN